jgi:TonB family protein
MVKNFAATGLALLGGFSLCLLTGCSLLGGSGKAGVAVPDGTSCPVPSQMVQAKDSDYGRSFLSRFSQRVSYPADALNAGQTGMVQLCARLDRDGVVRDGRIAAGSGFPLLDGAALVALGALQSAKEKAPLPQDFASGQKYVWISFPVNFSPQSSTGLSYQQAPEERPCKDTGTREGDLAARDISTEEWSGFPAQFSDAVRRELSYPPQAFEAKESGTTLLCVALDRDSRLIGVAISRSSGSPLLDGASLAALGMVQLKAEIPNLPERVRQGHDTIVFTQEIDWKP